MVTGTNIKKIKAGKNKKQANADITWEYIYIYLFEVQRRVTQRVNKTVKTREVWRKRSVKRSHLSLIPDRIGIEERPEEVKDRIIPGHWESDLIVGAENKSAIGTIVERTTRYVIIVKLKDKSAREVKNAFAEELKSLPDFMRKTLTHDNGLEMANHKLFTKETQMKVYFANPHSPWERGTNENTNMLIRDFYPKGTDFSKIPSGKLKHVQELLNNRPRKTLNWSTPNEVFSEMILKGKAGIAYTSDVI